MKHKEDQQRQSECAEAVLDLQQTAESPDLKQTDRECFARSLRVVYLKNIKDCRANVIVKMCCMFVDIIAATASC